MYRSAILGFVLAIVVATGVAYGADLTPFSRGGIALQGYPPGPSPTPVPPPSPTPSPAPTPGPSPTPPPAPMPPH